MKKIQKLHQAVPDAKIIVSSILWCTDRVTVRNPAYQKIASFNAACKEICQANGIAYADNDELCQKYIDTLWAPDGIHPGYGFYKYWAQNLILASLENEYGFESN